MRHGELARNLARKGEVWNQHGDVESVFNAAKTIIDRVYRTDYVYHAQLEPLNSVVWVMGAVVYGLGNALTERITFRNGRVQQVNFNDYKLPTMADTPGIHIEVLPGGDEPSAVGQTGAVLVAPAIANAFERLTGKRLRHMPFTRERVRDSLSA